jgi:dienelactone hydrolase
MRSALLLVSRLIVALGVALLCAVPVSADEPAANDATTLAPPARPRPTGDEMLAAYFRAETRQLADASLADIQTADDWNARRDEYRRQLLEMLGLDPLPERTDLQATVTGTTDHELFTVEKLHFQSRPGLYVTGNLYVPKGLTGPAPAILYVCGHDKVHYQHHGGWFARHGYVCLTIDTLQLGEIEGIHHGTYNKDLWWWNCRGYTPAGVEAWNCVRALDYLQWRPEVDGERIGVTGRSGGGAYSWWIAAIDDRITAAVPVAGITDLTNHVVDGVVEGHCDCMYMLNTYRWDYAQVAALVAPRPLLISNTDKDGIFPLEGVVRLHGQTRDIYRLLGAGDRLGLHITEGGHMDTQELHIHAFHWFNRFLKDQVVPIDKPAEKFFQPEQLKVFAELPTDEINTRIHETFVPAAEHSAPPADAAQWGMLRDDWLTALKEKSFRGWPAEGEPLDLRPAFAVDRDGLRFAAYDFTSQHDIELRLYVLHRAGLEKADLMVLNALDDEGWAKWLATMRVGFAQELADEASLESRLQPAVAAPRNADGSAPAEQTDTASSSFAENQKMFASFPWVMAYIAPRGVGLTAHNPTEQEQIQIRRRYMLLGQTQDGMRVWDTRRACQALRGVPGLAETPLWLQGERNMAGIALYASLFEPDIRRLDLWHLPHSHRAGPNFLNVMRYLDIPQAVALAAERSPVRIYQAEATGWEYPAGVAAALGWDARQLQVRAVPMPEAEAEAEAEAGGN